VVIADVPGNVGFAGDLFPPDVLNLEVLKAKSHLLLDGNQRMELGVDCCPEKPCEACDKVPCVGRVALNDGAQASKAVEEQVRVEPGSEGSHLHPGYFRMVLRFFGPLLKTKAVKKSGHLERFARCGNLSDPPVG